MAKRTTYEVDRNNTLYSVVQATNTHDIEIYSK